MVQLLGGLWERPWWFCLKNLLSPRLDSLEGHGGHPTFPPARHTQRGLSQVRP